MNAAEFEPETIIDGSECIVGRVASIVAQRALAGERIAIVNAEHMIVTGREEDVMNKYKKRVDLQSDRGPNYPSRPDGIVKRAIRGMVPYQKPRGRDAFERVRVYVGNPFDEAGQVLEDTTLDPRSNIRFVELGDVAVNLGANVTW